MFVICPGDMDEHMMLCFLLQLTTAQSSAERHGTGLSDQGENDVLEQFGRILPLKPVEEVTFPRGKCVSFANKRLHLHAPAPPFLESDMVFWFLPSPSYIGGGVRAWDQNSRHPP